MPRAAEALRGSLPKYLVGRTSFSTPLKAKFDFRPDYLAYSSKFLYLPAMLLY
jgi:hypothetical protein